ncbi:carbon-nitrogen hydrolase family protein [Falsarthrobacter nasiphocae]|uniref:Amidohydrolase n=1 Tax=Falsarthrobacter nasiphocae TaxID=189863 RepID=A0AAE4C6Y5_9MICC|nr:carbon-nitrogen hydrolase family protein [Falsarthrobacter nasiphocae]MDR6891939.1 putative amidohydrolase [Falsarthrobacter nasiphocae]
MKVALAQISAGPEPQENLRVIREQAEAAAAAGASLVVFPEASMRAFGHRLDTHAEPLDGPFAEGVRAAARDANLTIAVGLFTPAEDEPGAASAETGAGPADPAPAPTDPGAAADPGTAPARRRVRNTLFVTDGRGHETAYVKIHVYDAFGFTESETVQPGTRPAVHELGDVRLGLATCYDIRFPHLFAHYGRAGCSISLVPASWQPGPGKAEQWRLLAQARALDSGQFVLACDQAVTRDPDAPAGPTGVGGSVVVDPWGKVLAEAGEDAELLIADLDLGEVERARRALPVLAHARPLPGDDDDDACGSR